MKVHQYDIIRTKDGREGTVLEMTDDGRHLLVECSDSPTDSDLQDIPTEDVAQILYRWK